MSKVNTRMQPGLRKAIAAMPGKTFGARKRALAEALDISVQSINNWRRVPRKRIVSIERITGVPREAMAPELYR